MIPRDELQKLADLRPTAELIEAVERLTRERAEGVRAITENLIKAAKMRVAMGEERDRLTAGRPKGCECLGMGSWYRQSEVPDADGNYVHYSFCECPEGVAAKAESDQRAAKRRAGDVASFLERAGLPARFRQMSFESHPSRAAVGRLESWEPTPERGGLFLYGSYGTGKTGLAVSIMRAYIERACRSAMFVTAPDLLDAIRESYEKSNEPAEDVLRRAKRAGFLVLDDIGAERPTEWVREKLYQLVNHRHGEELATVFTSNLTLGELADRLGERTCWRIAEMCEIVHIEGANLREKRA